ncbi:DUF2218 domain-containing protein [Actinoplanes sp. URMC 104]|uniref:DUF2218 domain-containing protein n=1 Tax=Actinoplanes sp. URMC 104 TaxID=3423409 RepID=UPI003F1C612F
MTTHDSTLRSRADVPTPRGERWRKQLASHFGRKATVLEEDAGTTLLLSAGSCLLTYDDAALHLEATAADAESLARVEQVVGGHLERFAASTEALRVTWQPAP